MFVTAVAWTALVIAFVVSTHDPEVSSGSYAGGIAVGAVFGGLLPIAVYHALGRGFARRRGLVTVIWLASLVPFGYFLFFVLFISVDMAGCPPDAYECPL